MIRKLLRSTRGAATVEFAIVAPVLFLLLFGTFSVVQAMSVSGKLETAAGAIADMLTQNKSASTADLNNMVIAGQQILYPAASDAGTFAGRITLINFTAVGKGFKASVGWEYSFGSAPGAAPDANSFMALAQADVSILVVSLTYRFRPTLVTPIFDHIDFAKTAVARPRKSYTITRL